MSTPSQPRVPSGPSNADMSAFAGALADPDAFRALLDTLDDGVYLVDRRRTIRFWNRASHRISGYSSEEVVGRRCYADILRHVDECGTRLCQGQCPLADAMADGQARHRRLWLQHKSGHRVPVQVRTAPICDDAGLVIGGIEFFTDDSELQHSQDEIRVLERQALVDPLTGLRNRRYLDMVLGAHLAELRREEIPFAVLFADIDHFKKVNDEHGHTAGDSVLRTVADTLAANVRASDVVIRFGGEEFVILLRNGIEGEALTPTVERLRSLVAASAAELEDGTSVSVTLSIGATRARSTDSADDVLRRADTLLYCSKHEGRDRLTLG